MDRCSASRGGCGSECRLEHPCATRSAASMATGWDLQTPTRKACNSVSDGRSAGSTATDCWLMDWCPAPRCDCGLACPWEHPWATHSAAWMDTGWDLQTPSRKACHSMSDGRCNGSCGRTLRRTAGGWIVARRLAATAAQHAAGNIRGRLARLHGWPQDGICRRHRGGNGARCLSPRCTATDCWIDR